ncbi:MAG: hypothetical protein JO222_10355, partial [Frankiales bacterium]|nr:hypothetical protein [Frankiales bacterium]
MRRSLLAAAAVALLAGCGSTVQQASLGASGQPAANGDSGLGVPTAAATAGAGSGVGVGTGPAGSNGAVGGPVAAGGTTGGGGTSTPGGTGGAPTGAGGRSRINTPLKLGIAYINNQTASSALGVADPRKNQVKAVIEAYVHGINATGGLDGRKLVPVEYEWHSGDGSWSTAAASACAKFTQDNHVSVVLDEAFGTVGGFRDCLQKAGVFDITNQTVGDNAASAAATLYAGVGGLTLDRTYSAVLTGEMQSGYLHKTDHLGVIVEGCPENERAWSRSLAPLVTRLGLPAPKVVTFNCIDSTAGGATDGQAAISNAILRFRQPPTVDRVMFVSAEEAAALLLFAESASSQDYHPGYLLSSNAQAHLSTESGTGFPADQIPQLHGVGNSPYGDV